MEKKIRTSQINWLPAILFAILPLVQLMGYIWVQLALQSVSSPNFSFYLSFLWAGAYILLALTLMTGQKNNLVICAFTFPVIVSLISLLLHYQKILAILDLITYGGLYFVVLGATGFLPNCKKAARYLSLIPGIVGLVRRICFLPHSLAEVVFAVICVLALLTAGIWAIEKSKEEPSLPSVPVTRLAGIGLILFGALFLVSRAIAVIFHYMQMLELMETLGIYITKEGLYGISTTEVLLCVIAGICSIYSGILLYHRKPAQSGKHPLSGFFCLFTFFDFFRMIVLSNETR